MAALKDMARNPKLAFYYGQKAVRSAPLRTALGGAVARMVGLRSTPMPTTGSVAAQLADKLKAQGFASLLSKQLSPSTVIQIREHLSTFPLYDYYGTGKQYNLADGIPADVVKIRHHWQDVIRCKPLMDLTNDPDILAAVTQRLGAAPTIASVEAWWTLGEHNALGKCAFDDIYHRDVDDLRFVKLFLYLTDTDLHSGAHRFILGSHRDTHFTRRGAITDEEIEATYPSERLLTVTGSAGTAFLEETWGIHRALLATKGRRLIFSVLYSLAAHAPFGPEKPTQPLPAGYDAYINRRLFRTR